MRYPFCSSRRNLIDNSRPGHKIIQSGGTVHRMSAQVKLGYPTMGLFSRIFGRPKLIDVLAPLDAATGKMVLTENVRIKWRPSQTAAPALIDDVVAVCRADASVKWMGILDVLEQPTGEIKIFVTISFDNPDVDLQRVAPKLQQVFSRYPKFKNRFFIGADIVPGVPAEAAAYRRPAIQS